MAHIPGHVGYNGGGPVPDRVSDAMGIAGEQASRRASGMNTGLPLTAGGQPDPQGSMQGMFHDWLRNKIPQLLQVFMQEMQGRQQGAPMGPPPASAGGGPTQPGLLGRPY